MQTAAITESNEEYQTPKLYQTSKRDSQLQNLKLTSFYRVKTKPSLPSVARIRKIVLPRKKEEKINFNLDFKRDDDSDTDAYQPLS